MFRVLDLFRPSRHPRPRRPEKRRSFRPTLEVLEDRLAPAVYTVTTNTDNNPTGNGVGTGNNGDLRWCMNHLQDSTDTTNQIQFAPGVSGTIDLTQPLPTISKNVTITGPGAGTLTVARANGAPQFSIFTVPRTITAEIDGLTIENGSAAIGGGILNAGNLTLTNDEVWLNQATGDGGLQQGFGGGILNSTSGNLTVIDSNIAENSASSGGGGIANWGTLTTSCGTEIMGNSAPQGGGFLSGAPNATAVLWDNTAIMMNKATGNLTGLGGGVYVPFGNFTMHGGGIGNNTAAVFGGGLYNAGGQVQLDSGVGVGMNQAISGGGLYLSGGTTTLDTVTIMSNIIDLAGQGKGIYRTQAATLNQTNVTNPDGIYVAP